MFVVNKDAIEALALASMGRKLRAGQMLYGGEVGGAIVPSEEGDFLTELAREVLRSAEVDDLQPPFADGMNISPLGACSALRHSPLGCPTEVSPFLVPVSPRTWDEWLNSVTSLAGCQFRGDPVNKPMPICWVSCPFGVRCWRNRSKYSFALYA